MSTQARMYLKIRRAISQMGSSSFPSHQHSSGLNRPQEFNGNQKMSGELVLKTLKSRLPLFEFQLMF